MTGRGLTTGVSLVVAAVLLCIMGVWGYHAATAPIPADSSTSSSTHDPACAPQDQTVSQYVRRADVTVSVYNGGKRAGRAQATLDLFERAGFKPGEVGNAPDGLSVSRAAVYTTKADDPAAELVALALGHQTKVVHSDQEFGPGVAVVIGDRFKHLDTAAPSKVKLDEPKATCQ
jgi:LytR cell envelope-related transcriptional attenuator